MKEKIKKVKKVLKYVLIVLVVILVLLVLGSMADKIEREGETLSLLFIIIILSYVIYHFYKDKEGLETENYNLKEKYREDLEEMVSIIEDYVEDEDAGMFKNKIEELKEKIEYLEE